MKQYYKTGLKLLAVAVIGCLITYYSFFVPISVKVITAGKEPIAAEAMGTGTLEARIHATISPKISGRLAQVLVDQGDKVSKGQILATLDDKDLLQQVEMAKAELDVAKAGIESTISEVKRSEAIERDANTSFARDSQLARSNVLSGEDLDKAKRDMEVSKAELNRSRSAKIEAEKQVIKAEASLRYYQERLADTKICAPFNGLIIKRTRDSGNIIVPGSMILDMISLDQLWISAWVDETMLDKLKVGQVSKIVFRSDPKTELPGKVARISPQVDTETREVLVDVTVDRLPQSWAVGQRAEVFIETDRKENATVIPQRVIVWRQQQPGVFVIENGRTHWQKIVLGLQGKDKAEAAKGLQPGQVVLIPGSKLPRDGRAVRVITK